MSFVHHIALLRRVRRSCIAITLVAISALATAVLPTPGAHAAVLARTPVSLTAAAPGGASVQAAAGDAHAAVDSTSHGLTPDQISNAYGLPTTGARHQTIAIVSAYDDPDLQSDLAAYDKRFKLPPCTTANGCLRKLNQQGRATPLPPADTTGQWVTESALGTEIAHGLCQSCRILLVEATIPDESDFSDAAKAAAGAGATVVVSTFTGIETESDGNYMGDYANPKAAFVAAVGDPLSGTYGYNGNLNFPSALPSVLAVGGSQLRTTANGGYLGESAWKGTVSGCSFYELAPPWQARIRPASDCGSERADADVSAVADPGAIVHIADAGQAGGPWYVANGTSLSAPVIGAVIGLAGSAGNGEDRMLYSREQTDPGAFHDIVTGANAPICKAAICKAGRGWDGPTGLGTPAGLEAFLPGGPKLASAHPRISFTAAKRQLQASRRWTVSLGLANGNAFRIRGSIDLQRTLRIGGGTHLVKFATTPFKRGSLKAGSTKLTIANSERRQLTSAHSLLVYAVVHARGSTGRSVTVMQKLTLTAP